MQEFMWGKQLSGQWHIIEQIQEKLIRWITLSDLCFYVLKLHKIDGDGGKVMLDFPPPLVIIWER